VDSVDGLSADDIPDLLPSLPKSAEGKYFVIHKQAIEGQAHRRFTPVLISCNCILVTELLLIVLVETLKRIVVVFVLLTLSYCK
jgi:hypothetical protein